MSSKITRFEKLLEPVPDALVGMDHEGLIRFVNRQTEALFGYDRDQLIGQPIATLVPDPFWQIYAERREGYLNDTRSRSGGLDLALSGRQREGTEFPIDISLSLIDTVDVLLVITAVLDVAHQKRAVKTAELTNAIVEYSEDAIIGSTLEGIITSWNPAAERIYGYSSEETIGKCGALLVPGDRTGDATAVLQQVKDGEVLEHFESTLVRKDGTPVPVSITVAPIRDKDGAVVGVSAVHRDVTKQREAFEAAQRLAWIVEYSEDAILSGSLEGMVTSWNPAAARMFGYSSEEIIGRSAAILTPPDRAGEIQTFVAKISTGQHVRDYETKRVRKDGTVFPISLTVSPVRDADGAVSGTSVIYRDLTEQRGAFETAQRMTSIVENSNDAIIAASPDGVITTWNSAAQRIYGYSSEEIIGKRVDILVPKDRTGELSDALEQIRAGQHVSKFGVIGRRKDGTTFPIQFSASPIRDADDAVVGVSSIVRDVTNERRTAEAAQREQAEHLSRQRLDRILTLTPAVIFVIDDTNGWTPKPMSGNIQNLFGYGQSRLSEGPAFWDEIIHPDDGDAPLAPRAPTLGAGRYQCEYRFRHGDGSWHWVNEQLLVRRAEGGPAEVIGSWTDITTSRATLKALRIADEQRQELLIHLAAAHEEERTHLSRELHDNLGQILTSASLFAKAAWDDILPERRELHDKVRSLIDEALASTRSLVWTLRGSPQSDSLEMRLRRLVDDVRADTSVKVNLTFHAHAGSVSSSAEAVVFRIVQEALTNVMRHANAGNAWILVTATGSQIEAVIWDDGIGFDTRATLTSASHTGLLSMQERAHALGGTLTIDARPGHGTSVRLDLPADGNAT